MNLRGPRGPASTPAPRSLPDSLRGRGPRHAQGRSGEGAGNRATWSKSFTVHAHGFSASAREKIEAAGGRWSYRSNSRCSDPLQGVRVPESGKSSMYTAAMLAVFRFGSFMPVPGINIEAVDKISKVAGANMFGFLNLFSGGSLQRFAISPGRALHHRVDYVAAADRRHPLWKAPKEGEVGQQKITQYTRYVTVGLAFVQSVGYVFLFRTFSSGRADVVNNFSFGRVFVIVDHPHRRQRAPHVARRADHPARHRQRDLADDLRLDRRRGSRTGSRRGGTTRTRSSW